MSITQLVYILADKNLGVSSLEAFTNTAASNICVQVFVTMCSPLLGK